MKASIFIGTSLDGFIARSNGDLDFLPPGDGEPHGYDEIMSTVDALVRSAGVRHSHEQAFWAAYERYMGTWSRLAGETFLDWLAPKPGLRWLDVGCGNGAFTEMLVERSAPASVQGIDPSEAQLAYARTRPASRVAQFRLGDAMAQPFLDDTFDAACRW